MAFLLVHDALTVWQWLDLCTSVAPRPFKACTDSTLYTVLLHGFAAAPALDRGWHDIAV